MRSARILLVDDEVGFTEPLALRLDRRDFSVTTVESGDEAIVKTDEAEFDVALVDIFMPGRDGLETLREIKRRRPLTEVILLSGKGTNAIAIEGMQCGAYDFLTKPLDFAELLQKIEAAYTRKLEQLARIRRASAAESEQGGAAAQGDSGGESAPAAAAAGFGEGCKGRLLVLGQQSEFPKDLVEYALDMAQRLSYEVVALNAAGFSKQTFRSFPGARDKVCQDFLAVSEDNAVPFREAAAEKGIPFSHLVKFSSADEAAAEVRDQVGDIDYVICESEERLEEPEVRGPIVAYTPV
jgi:DNA-binding NarL/FixJ family response regulator